MTYYKKPRINKKLHSDVDCQTSFRLPFILATVLIENLVLGGDWDTGQLSSKRIIIYFFAFSESL